MDYDAIMSHPNDPFHHTHNPLGANEIGCILVETGHITIRLSPRRGMMDQDGATPHPNDPYHNTSRPEGA